MKVIKELIHYLYWERQLLSFDEYDQVMEVVTPGRNMDENENYDDRWTTDQIHGPYKALWKKEDLWEEQILEALDRREEQRGYNRKRRSPKSGLKQRRARTLKPKDKTRLTLSGLVNRIAKRAPSWTPSLQAVAILNRELDPNGFFRKEDAEDHAAPMYERIPMAPLLDRFSRPEVVAALDSTLSERILPATALVRFLSFKGPRNLVKLHRDKGGPCVVVGTMLRRNRTCASGRSEKWHSHF